MSKKSKAELKQKNMELLRANGIEWKTLSEECGHVRIDDIDFWLSTGKWVLRSEGHWGQGVMELVRFIGPVTDKRFCEEHDDESCFGEVIQCGKCKFKIV